LLTIGNVRHMRARGTTALDSHITRAGSGSLKFTSREVAGRVGTSTTKSRRKSRQSSCEYASAGFSARPYPGNVGAYTCARSGAHQEQALPGPIIPHHRDVVVTSMLCRWTRGAHFFDRRGRQACRVISQA